MNLFQIENNVVTFSPQALLIEPFKKIWDSDKSKSKNKATLELAFLYYFSDDRSDFMHVLDEDERAILIKDFLSMPASFKHNTKIMVRAIHTYQKLSETTSKKMLVSTRGLLAKIASYMDNINMDERDPRTNKPIHDLSKIAATVEKVPKLVKALNAVEKEVIKERELKSQSGNKTIAMFEEGL